MKKRVCQILLLLCTAQCMAQSVLDKPINISVQDKKLDEALYLLIEASEVDISFSNSIIPEDKVVNIRMFGVPIGEVLKKMLDGTGLKYQLVGGQIAIVKKKPVPLKKYTVSGFIRDKSNGERVIGATVFDAEKGTGTISNEFGFFSISLPEGESVLMVSSMGYDADTVGLQIRKDISFEINLAPSFLAEVIVSSKDSTLMKTDVGGIHLNLKQAGKLPSLGGEPDVFRLAYTLPGFQAGADGFGGISVRGGNVDQNLFLLDGVPVYNASHGIGIFSVYNSNAIQDAKVYKGAFPAKYGGRLSSVWDIQTKRGNFNQFQGEFDLGLSSGTLTLEGPVNKGKGSFFFSGRRAFFDFYSQPITRRVRKDRGVEGALGYYFYDFNFKVNHKLSKKDRLLFSYYNGKDTFDDLRKQETEFGDSITYLLDDEEVTWGNTIANLRWNHRYSPTLFGSTSLALSQYKYGSQDFVQLETFGPNDTLVSTLIQKYDSEIEDRILSLDFDYAGIEGHQIEFGGGVTWHKFQTGVFNFIEEEDIETLSLDTLGDWTKSPFRSTEFNAYIQDEMRLGDYVVVNLGLRLGAMSVENQLYFSPQPRLSVEFTPREDLKTHLAVSRMSQFLHLLSPSSLGLPKDLWVTATRRIPPQHAWQFQIGGEKKLKHGFSFGTDVYYRKLTQLLIFKESSVENVTSTSWQNRVASGSGRAYGAEFLLKQESPKFGGWLAYTLAWSDRHFPTGEVNKGARFPIRLDRRHNVNLQFLYKFNEKWNASIGYVFSSGTAFNFPSQQYQIIQPPDGGAPTVIGDTPIQIVDELNDRRMPAYHRMDIAFNRYFWQDETRHSIKLGFYNLYNRKNPLYFTLRDRFDEENVLTTEVIQVSLLPIFPTLRYTLELR